MRKGPVKKTFTHAKQCQNRKRKNTKRHINKLGFNALNIARVFTMVDITNLPLCTTKNQHRKIHAKSTEYRWSWKDTGWTGKLTKHIAPHITNYVHQNSRRNNKIHSLVNVKHTAYFEHKFLLVDTVITEILRYFGEIKDAWYMTTKSVGSQFTTVFILHCTDIQKLFTSTLTHHHNTLRTHPVGSSISPTAVILTLQFLPP